MNLAGRDLTDHMKLLLRKTGTNFTTSAELDIVRDIKVGVTVDMQYTRYLHST